MEQRHLAPEDGLRSQTRVDLYRPLALCAPLAGGLGWLGADLWRLGGGVAILLWVLGFYLVVLPLILGESALSRASGLPLPAALGRSGAAGEWAGWLGLTGAAGVAVLAAPNLAWSAGALTADSAVGGGIAGLLSVGVWMLAAAAAVDADRAARLLAGCGRALVLLLVAFFGQQLALAPDLALSLLVPRGRALTEPAVIAGGLLAPLLVLPAGLGLLSPMVGALHERVRSSATVALSAILAATLLLAGGIAGFCALGASLTLPLDGDPSALLGGGGLMVALRLVGTTGLCTLTLRALVLAAQHKWGGQPDAWVTGLATVFASCSTILAFSGLPDPASTAGGLFSGLLWRWTAGFGLPLIALLVASALSRRIGSELASVDREGGLGLSRWLPWTLRWPVRLTLLAGLIAGAVALSRGFPGANPEPGRGADGALGGLLFALAPVAVLLWLVIGSSAALWWPPAEERP